MPRPTLYLDIDDVLNDTAWQNSAERAARVADWCERHACDPMTALLSQPAMDILPQYTARIRRIIEATGCAVILCSAWRQHYSFVQLHTLFAAHGIVLDGTTPPRMSRFSALLAHAVSLPPGTRWAVLDDAVTCEWARDHGGYAVQPQDGVTEEDADNVIAFLRRQDAA